MRSFKIWLSYSKNAFLQSLTNRVMFILFMFGRCTRVLLFAVFLYFLLQSTNGLGGYTKYQIIFFYLSFNLVDTISQFLFREVYRFRELVIRGDLDLVLVKPINPLLRVLLGWADAMDLIMMVIITGAVVYFGVTAISFDISNWLVFGLLIINSIIISAAFHILVLAIGVLTTSIDHLMMVFRDTTSILRIPVDVYSEPLRGIITFVIPLGIMMTFPPKALMGLLDLPLILISFLISIVFFFLSHWFWKRSLREYQSASS